MFWECRIISEIYVNDLRLGWHQTSVDINVDLSTIVIKILNVLGFSIFTEFNQKYVLNFFRKVDSLNSPAGFKLMMYRSVEEPTTHCAMLIVCLFFFGGGCKIILDFNAYPSK